MKRSQTSSEGSTTASTKSSNNNGMKYRPTFSTIGKLQTPDLYKHHADQYQQTSIQMNDMEAILELEKDQNKMETWNKLDKALKRQKLHAYAEHYGQEQSMAVREVKKLKSFFSDCLDKGKLTRTKDVSYNKEKREIEDIPALVYTAPTHHFSLRNTDAKYVSTLKSMTPKRIISAPSLADLENDMVSSIAP
jgi:septum formation inhibitor MinC